MEISDLEESAMERSDRNVANKAKIILLKMK